MLQLIANQRVEADSDVQLDGSCEIEVGVGMR
jgi:hypothetical protein